MLIADTQYAYMCQGVTNVIVVYKCLLSEEICMSMCIQVDVLVCGLFKSIGKAQEIRAPMTDTQYTYMSKVLLKFSQY
jgi:hypothetical protein